MNHDSYDNVNKAALKRLAYKGGKLALKGLKSVAGKALGPYLVIALAIVLGIFLLIGAAYSAIIVVPQELSRQNETTVIFNTGDDSLTDWTKQQDQELFEEYKELAAQYKDGLSKRQQEQAQHYKLNWAVLAAVDRVTGDPTINLGIEELIKPQPEKHYKQLKPKFEWKTSTITKVIEWQEIELIEGSEVEKEYKIVDKRKVETEEVKLLTSVDTFEADYTYEYKLETTATGKAGLNRKKVTTTKEVVGNITESGPYYLRLKNILGEYGLTDIGSNPMNLELMLELASSYDDEFKYSLERRWISANSAIDFSKSFYEAPSTLGKIIWPLPKQYNSISSPFGWRIHPIKNRRSLHTGTDIPAPRGTDVRSISDGYVRYSGNYGGYGMTVIVEHGQQTYSLYAHLSKTIVDVEDEVKRGEKIGEVGSTGLSTGPHLHYEIRNAANKGVTYKNPLNLYQ